MANVIQSGSAYVDSTGLLYSGRIKVSHIVLTTVGTAEVLRLTDSGTVGSPGTLYKIKLTGPAATSSYHFDFSGSPILFNSGIYCETITAGLVVTIVATSAGREG